MVVGLDKYRSVTKTNFIRENLVEFVTESTELFNIIQNSIDTTIDFLYNAKRTDRYILMKDCRIIKISNDKDEIYTIRFEYGQNIHMDKIQLRLFKLKNYILND